MVYYRKYRFEGKKRKLLRENLLKQHRFEKVHAFFLGLFSLFVPFLSVLQGFGFPFPNIDKGLHMSMETVRDCHRLIGSMKS